MKVKIINGLIAMLSLGIFFISYLNEIGTKQLAFCIISGVMFLIFFFSLFKKEKSKTIEKPAQIHPLSDQITELALLNDEHEKIAFWGMYGKSSLVLGLDIGENKVDVNLLNSTYASTVDVEHAVLNYAENKWYIEDLGSENGTSIVKSDGKQYKLTIGKPCLVEKGDILYISLTKLQIC